MTFPDKLFFDGNWEVYVEDIYSFYLDFIVNSDLQFNTFPVRTKYHPATDEKGFGFWHIISDGKVEDDRNIDFRRCESLPWVPFFITNAVPPPSEIFWWKNKRSGSTHIVIASTSNKFVVILAERNGYYLLKTSYIARTRRYEKMLEECNDYWENPW